MNEKSLSEMTLEELKAKEKAAKKGVIFWSVLIGIMVISAIIVAIKKGAGLKLATPFVFVFFLIAEHNKWKKVKEEITSRSGK
jgi:hypothetical protein